MSADSKKRQKEPFCMASDTRRTQHSSVTSDREEWPKVTLIDCIKEVNERNSRGKLSADAVRGISTEKEFIDTKANLEGVNLSTYKIVKPKEFAFVSDTSRRGDKMSLAFNVSDIPYLVSSISTVYEVEAQNLCLPEYLYLQFKRSEFDRYARFNSWGSARETFNWEDMCRIKIPLPPIKVQKAYVDAYRGLIALIEENEKLIKTLEQTALACIVECREKWSMVSLEFLIEEVLQRNIEEKFGVKELKGVTSQGLFDKTKATTEGLSFKNYKIVKKGEFAYNPSRINLGSIALLDEEIAIVSPMYVVFKVVDEKKLLSEYLFLWYKRKEFLRSTLFYAVGSVRDTFNLDDMRRVKIPLPPIKMQKAIVAIYHCAEEARKIAEETKRTLASVCPAMIQRASHRGL